MAVFPFAEGNERNEDGNNKKKKWNVGVGGREGIVCMYSLIEWAYSDAEYGDVMEMQVAKLLYPNLNREGNTFLFKRS